MTTIHPIEAESYRILAERVDLSHLETGPRAVVERVIHASADLEYADTMRFDAGAVDAAIDALQAGAPIVTDVEMVRAAIPGALCYLPPSADPTCLQDSNSGPNIGTNNSRAQSWRHSVGQDALDAPDVPDVPTRSALGMREAAARHPVGAVVVVGCAPTALVEAVELDWEPALIVGLPVGFVGAAESKALARESRHLTITNVGEKGGSAVAAGAVNALRRIADAR